MANLLEYNPVVTLDARKAVNLNSLPAEAWRVIAGPQTAGDMQEAYRFVWALNRAVQIRRDAFRSMPFEVRRGENVVDSSTDYNNAIGMIPNPIRALGLIEASQCIWGSSYFEKGRNAFGKAKDIFYMLPSSITPKLTEKGLESFNRRVKGKDIVFQPKDVLYIWADDPYVELGPPESSPVLAASMSAGVMLNIDRFSRAFFERGAIRATLLTTNGQVMEADRERLKAWWARTVAGVKKAFTTDVVNADKVNVVQVGDGMDALKDGGLSEQRAKAIATAMGVPASLLFANAANYATAQEDRLNFYETTIIPECRFVENVLNEQLFAALGLKLKFTEQDLDIYQEDEADRSKAALGFMDFLAKCETEALALEAADMFGYSLTDGMVRE